MAKKLWTENIEVLPAILFQEADPGEDFTDRTNDMFAWDLYGQRVLDYKRVRDNISPLFYAVAGSVLENWAGLDGATKLIGAKYFFATYALRVPDVVSEQVDSDNWEILTDLSEGHDKSNYVGRADTVEAMRIYITHKLRIEVLTLADIQDIYRTVTDLLTFYIKTADPKFYQWLTNEVGSVYEEEGFAQKSYYDAEIKADLLSILAGNY